MQAYEIIDARLRVRDTDNVTRDATEIAEYRLATWGNVGPVHWYHDTLTTLHILTDDDP